MSFPLSARKWEGKKKEMKKKNRSECLFEFLFFSSMWVLVQIQLEKQNISIILK